MFQAKPLRGKVSKILTWKWVESPSSKEEDDNTKKRNRQRQREYFVKWADMSYWHCSWVSELQVNINYFVTVVRFS